ncbi:MAG: CBS domain-containing protein [Spirulina sp.]
MISIVSSPTSRWLLSTLQRRGVIKIRGSATVAEAIKLMREHQLHALIIESYEEEQTYSIVTETNIVDRVIACGQNPNQILVCEIMSTPQIIVNPNSEVESIAPLFSKSRIRLALVIQRSLLGIIAVSDILNKTHFFEKPKTSFELYLEKYPNVL